MAGQILGSTRVQEATGTGRKERGAYRKGKGISLNRVVRAIDHWFTMVRRKYQRWCTTGASPSFLSPPQPPEYLPSFPLKLLHSPFAFATDVPFTDLSLIYNTYRPPLSLFDFSPLVRIPSRCPDSGLRFPRLLCRPDCVPISNEGPPFFSRRGLFHSLRLDYTLPPTTRNRGGWRTMLKKSLLSGWRTPF